jgi:hypothetical protein
MTPNEPDEPPPFLVRWKRIYAVVLVYLLALILVFLWFTQTWNR